MSDPKVEEIRARLAKRATGGKSDVGYLLEKLDDALFERDAAIQIKNGNAEQRDAAEQRERALIAGVREIRTIVDETMAAIPYGALDAILSRLLPSTPTEEHDHGPWIKDEQRYEDGCKP